MYNDYDYIEDERDDQCEQYKSSGEMSIHPGRYEEERKNHDDGVSDGKKRKDRRLPIRIVALCLCCALLGGVAGGAGVALLGIGRGSNGNTRNPTVINYEPGALKIGEGIERGVYEALCSSVVGVTTEKTVYNVFGQKSTSASLGSGFILTEDGYILTNHHVVDGAQRVYVDLYDGGQFEAEVIGKESANTDVALLKIDARGLTPVKIGNSSGIYIGEGAVTIGNPLGELTYTMTSGIVSALDRAIKTDTNTTINMFQIDVAVNSGNSGSPVFDKDGSVIGIVTAKYKASGVEGLGFAIPIDDVMSIVNDIMNAGHIPGKPRLGITVTTVTEDAVQYYRDMVKGAYVYEIDESACAAKAGLEIGDIIIKFGGKDIKSSNDLIAAKRDYSAGDKVKVTYYRGGEYYTAEVVLDEEPYEERAAAA